MEKWINKVAIVTGASVGIGRDISIKLVDHGLKVVGCGRNFDNLLKVQTEIPKDSKGEFIPFQCDVSKEEDVLKMFDYVKTHFKELSILINNAGFSLYGSIIDAKTEDLKSMLGTNVLGVCTCTREAYSMMKENENKKSHLVPGHIINISGGAGYKVLPFKYAHFYSATKFALTAITEGTRQELREAKSNIRITQISPGYVETEFAKRSFGADSQAMKILNYEPLQPSDVSHAIIFSLSAAPRSAAHEVSVRPNQELLF